MEVRKIKKNEPLNKKNPAINVINEIDYSIATKIISFLLKEGLITPTINDDNYQINNEKYSNYGRYMNLELIQKYGYGMFGKDELLDNGLGTIQGPSKATLQLVGYLEMERKGKLMLNIT